MTTSSTSDLAMFEINATTKISVSALQRLLPDVETALFFAKVYKLDYHQLGRLLRLVFNTSVIQALTEGDHSTELQDYLVDTLPDHIVSEATFAAEAPTHDSELLVQLFEAAKVQVASSIQEVANKLSTTLGRLPSKEGAMLFQSLRVMNRNRPTIGDYRARIQHQQVSDVAVVLDVSGSMSEDTIRAIIADVVSLSWSANAHLFIVSNNTYHWEPGSYDVESVLKKAEYGGTHYETLAPMLQRTWGTVITIADYDSSPGAKAALSGSTICIGQVLDISLVNRTTYLAECLGQRAQEVKPLLVAAADLTSVRGY